MDRPAEEYPLFRRFLPAERPGAFSRFTIHYSLDSPLGGSCRRSRLRGRPPQSRLLVGGCAAGCQPSANLQPPGSPRPRRKCAVTSIFAQQKSRRRADPLRSRWRLCRPTDAAYPLRVFRPELIPIRAPAKAQLLWDPPPLLLRGEEEEGAETRTWLQVIALLPKKGKGKREV